MKNVSMFIVLLLTLHCASAQPLSTVIKSQAMEMGKALVAGDLQTFSRFMLPEMIEAGKETGKTQITMDSAFAIFKSFGGNVERISYGNPGKVVTYKNELQATLPQTTEITSPFADIVMSSALVAISRDNGKNWYFIDTSIGKIQQLKDKLPNLSPDLVIPEPEKPKITPKQ